MVPSVAVRWEYLPSPRREENFHSACREGAMRGARAAQDRGERSKGEEVLKSWAVEVQKKGEQVQKQKKRKKEEQQKER